MKEKTISRDHAKDDVHLSRCELNEMHISEPVAEPARLLREFSRERTLSTGSTTERVKVPFFTDLIT